MYSLHLRISLYKLHHYTNLGMYNLFLLVLVIVMYFLNILLLMCLFQHHIYMFYLLRFHIHYHFPIHQILEFVLFLLYHYFHYYNVILLYILVVLLDLQLHNCFHIFLLLFVLRYFHSIFHHLDLFLGHRSFLRI